MRQNGTANNIAFIQLPNSKCFDEVRGENGMEVGSEVVPFSSPRRRDDSFAV
jgi:hypothetical protein